MMVPENGDCAVKCVTHAYLDEAVLACWPCTDDTYISYIINEVSWTLFNAIYIFLVLANASLAKEDAVLNIPVLWYYQEGRIGYQCRKSFTYTKWSRILNPTIFKLMLQLGPHTETNIFHPNPHILTTHALYRVLWIVPHSTWCVFCIRNTKKSKKKELKLS